MCDAAGSSASSESPGPTPHPASLRGEHRPRRSAGQGSRSAGNRIGRWVASASLLRPLREMPMLAARQNVPALALVAVTLLGLVMLVRATDDPPQNPAPMDGEIRELKRRLDKLEGERAALTKRLEETVTGLGKANTRIDDTNKAVMLNAVPLGGIIPYFGSGENPPEGYVWADGKTKWPKEPWVPAHLQNEPVPDLSGRTIRGASAKEPLAT